jgi:hypothetical protein
VWSPYCLCILLCLCISPNFLDLWGLWDHLTVRLNIPPLSFRLMSLMSPCEGRLEYLHRSPASHRRRRKGNSVLRGIAGLPCHWGHKYRDLILQVGMLDAKLTTLRCTNNYCCRIRRNENRMFRFIAGIDKSGRIFWGRLWLKKGLFCQWWWQWGLWDHIDVCMSGPRSLIFLFSMWSL